MNQFLHASCAISSIRIKQIKKFKLYFEKKWNTSCSFEQNFQTKVAKIDCNFAWLKTSWNIIPCWKFNSNSFISLALSESCCKYFLLFVSLFLAIQWLDLLQVSLLIGAPCSWSVRPWASPSNGRQKVECTLDAFFVTTRL